NAYQWVQTFASRIKVDELSVRQRPGDTPEKLVTTELWRKFKRAVYRHVFEGRPIALRATEAALFEDGVAILESLRYADETQQSLHYLICEPIAVRATLEYFKNEGGHEAYLIEKLEDSEDNAS
ncbi:hypothetical protein BZG36_05515, partial [Bifiguratus adelaidae]